MKREDKEMFEELSETWEEMKVNNQKIHPKYVDWLINKVTELEKENKEQKDNLETLESAYWDR